MRMATLRLLLGCALAAGAAAYAEDAPVSPFRVDVTGRVYGKKIELEAVNGEGLMRGKPPHWYKAGNPLTDLMFAGVRPKKEEWRPYAFAFTPKEKGFVELHFCAEWTKEAEKRGWVDLTAVTVNGEPLTNGTFVEAAPDQKTGQPMPKGFWLAKRAQYLPDGGPDGTGAVRVNHDNRMHHRLPVEANVTYTIQLNVRAAPPPPPEPTE